MIIKFLTNLFNFKKTIKYNDTNYIIFQFGKNKDDIELIISLIDLDTVSGQKFGELLFAINEGYYTNTILQILNNISSDSLEHKKFTTIAINKWAQKISEHGIKFKDENKIKDTNKEDPLILPSQFSKLFDK
jgi:hypothetical protein